MIHDLFAANGSCKRKHTQSTSAMTYPDIFAICDLTFYFLCTVLSEVIVITTREVHKMMSSDSKIKLDVKMKLDVVCIQEDGDMGTADALRHIQERIKVCVF